MPLHESPSASVPTIAVPSAAASASVDIVLNDYLFTSAPIGLAVIDGQGRIQRSNRKLRQILRLPPASATVQSSEADPLLHRPLAECLVEADRAGLLADLATLQSERDTVERELRLSGQGGEPLWVGWSALAVRGPDRALIACLSYFIDISDRVRSEQAQRKSEERSRRLAEASTEAVIIHDGGVLLDVNLAALAMFGYTRQEMIGKPISRFASPATGQVIDERVSSGGAQTYEGVGVRKDGSTFIGIVSSRSADFEGQKVRIACIRDISEQRHAEIELRESEERFRIISQLSSEALLLHENGVIFECNEAAAQMARASHEQLIGCSVFRFIAPEEQARVAELIKRNSEEPYEAECVRFDGDRFTARVAARLVPYQGRTVRGTTMRDVTSLRTAEQTLRQSVEQQAKLQAQADLLAEMSTPLIPLSSEIVVMPLIGTLDSQRAEQVLVTLLDGITRTGARVAILDITGVRTVDTYVASVLTNAAQAVRLLGAEAILTGIRAEVAQVLVSLGVELRGVVTRSTLQSGIAYAQRGSKSGNR